MYRTVRNARNALSILLFQVIRQITSIYPNHNYCINSKKTHREVTAVIAIIFPHYSGSGIVNGLVKYCRVVEVVNSVITVDFTVAVKQHDD